MFNFLSALLQKSVFTNVYCENCNFSNVNFSNAILDGTNFINCDFKHTEFGKIPNQVCHTYTLNQTSFSRNGYLA